MAKEMEYDVVVASMDAQLYVDFCVRVWEGSEVGRF